jgi:pilus assembly protein CpaB
MMKKRGLLLVMLSVLIAAGAAFVANNYVNTRLTSAAAGDSPNVTIMAAAMRIPYGTKLESRHVKTMEVPENVLPPGAIRDFKEIDGQIVKSDIMDGEIILADRVAGAGTGSALAALVAPNKRAVTVRVNDVIGVGGFLLPGNFVDVLGTRLEMGGNRRATTQTIINMVKVLAVDQTAASDKNEPVVVRAVTLELTPKEAEVLVKWEEEGTIQLALRNPNDTLVAENEPEPEPKPAPRPAKRAAPTVAADDGQTVTLIRGTKVQNQKAKG